MKILKTVLLLITTVILTPVYAHDPIFGMGPHVLFKGGTEISITTHLEKAAREKETELGIELVKGITGKLAIGIEVPYLNKREPGNKSSGVGDVSIFSKYRFWKKDSFALQQSAAVSLKIKSHSGNNNSSPPLGTGSTDSILGLAYGYEGRKYYRWASARYRYNGENNSGLRRGNVLLLDLVWGIRPKLTGYREPDTVWMIELNSEFYQKNELNGVKAINTGGRRLFVSPGIFWTHRNFAIKAGIQIPISQSLNGTQDKTDYRAKLTFEWHL